MTTISPPSPPPPGALWAKLERDAEGNATGWHSLVDHSADVAAVVEALLDQPVMARRLARAGGRDALDATTCARLAALAFLHDAGKANRGFRRRVDPRAQPVIGHIGPLAWLLFGQNATALVTKFAHVLGLERVFDWFGDDGFWEYWRVLLAHHGRPASTDPPDARPYWCAGADGDPIAALAPLRTGLDRWFAPAFPSALAGDGPPLPDAPAFQHAFAGLLMLADWLGSDRRFFPFANGCDPDRMAFARPAAAAALAATGLAVEPRRQAVIRRAPDFGTLFEAATPRPLQQDATLPAAPLVVLEAETGSGKTEAALWRFQHLFAHGAVDGLYFALPTRVAATQMFARVKRLCHALFPPDDRPAVVLAVPGQVGADDARGHPLPDFGFAWDDDPGDAARQARWAAERPKRFLAAQIAVGTLDQALLAAIRVRHAHLRGAALLRHLLVVDEVHASDHYMAALLQGLLRGHLAAGGHALLLSATLGAGLRARLLETPCPPQAEAEALAYPALGWAETGRLALHPLAATGAGKEVEIEAAPLIGDAAAVAARALAAAEAGARVLVVRNTVADAIATALALEAAAGPAHPALFRVAGVATLHHGRFAPADRIVLDRAVEAAFGRASKAGARVVIGTQTLEQSLDLDADLLITDLCPADVLLQRIGRLHRHAGRTRPEGFTTPRAVVLVPAERSLLPLVRRGGGRHGLGRVYNDARVIEATWRLIEAEPCWRIPAMNRHLVEQVTHPERLAAIEDELVAGDAGWREVADRIWGKASSDKNQADYGLLDRAQPFSAFEADADDVPTTRLGARDLLVAVAPPLTSPFGETLAALKVPSFLAEGVPPEAPLTLVAHEAGETRFTLGAALFRYDRFGLRRDGER